MKSNKEFLNHAKALSDFLLGEYNECSEYEEKVYADRGLSVQQKHEQVRNSWLRAYSNLIRIRIQVGKDDDKGNMSPLAVAVRKVIEAASVLMVYKNYEMKKLVEEEGSFTKILNGMEKPFRKKEEELFSAFNQMNEIKEELSYYSSYNLEFFSYDELVTYEECLVALREDIAVALLFETTELKKKGVFVRPNLRLIKEKWEVPLNKVSAVWIKLNCPYKTRVFAGVNADEMDDITVFEYILRTYVESLERYIKWHTEFYRGIQEKRISIHELTNENSPYIIQRTKIFAETKQAEELFNRFREDRIEGAYDMAFE